MGEVCLSQPSPVVSTVTRTPSSHICGTPSHLWNPSPYLSSFPDSFIPLIKLLQSFVLWVKKTRPESLEISEPHTFRPREEQEFEPQLFCTHKYLVLSWDSELSYLLIKILPPDGSRLKDNERRFWELLHGFNAISAVSCVLSVQVGFPCV